MKLAKYKDAYTNTLGVFYYLQDDISEFLTFFDVTREQLDNMFYIKFSWKYLIPSMFYWEINEDGEPEIVEEADKELISHMAFMNYKNKWDRYLALAKSSYDPLNPLQENIAESQNIGSSQLETQTNTSEEDRTINTEAKSVFTGANIDTDTGTIGTNSTNTRTDNLSESISGTRDDTTTRTDNLTETNRETRDITKSQTLHNQDGTTGSEVMDQDSTSATTGTDSNTNNIYGFNSSNGVPSDSSSGQNSSSTTETLDYTLTKNNTVTKTTTGSQEIGEDGTINDTKNNTGTQTTVLDSENTETKLNTGTQSSQLAETRTNSNESTSSRTNNTEDTTDVNTNIDITSSHSRNFTGNEDKTRGFIRSGNINHLQSDIVNEELKTWRWNFLDTILNDMKDFITVPIY